MWNRLIAILILCFWGMKGYAQMKSDTVIQKRQPTAIELQQLRIYADSIRLSLFGRDTVLKRPTNQLLMNYVQVYDYFLTSHEVVQFTNKQVKVILGKADTTMILSSINHIQVWQYGKLFENKLTKTMSPVYRFYFRKGQLISVARLDN